MLILVLNAGSSSLKFNLMDMEHEESLADGIAERIGLSEGFIRWTIQGEKGRLELDMNGHRKALTAIMEQLHKTVLVGDREVGAVGHRVAHGGPNFGDPELITPAVLAEIEELAFYAPAAQSRQRLGHPHRPGAVPRRAPGGGVRHRLPPHHARTTPTPTACPTSSARSWACAATASTAPATSTWPNAPPCCWASPWRRQDHHLPPGQRQQHHRRARRQERGHLHGPHPAGRA